MEDDSQRPSTSASTDENQLTSDGFIKHKVRCEGRPTLPPGARGCPRPGQTVSPTTPRCALTHPHLLPTRRFARRTPSPVLQSSTMSGYDAGASMRRTLSAQPGRCYYSAPSLCHSPRCLAFLAQALDIKRANGLLTDSGMFALGEVLIPKKQLPLGWVNLSLPCRLAQRLQACPSPPLHLKRHVARFLACWRSALTTRSARLVLALVVGLCAPPPPRPHNMPSRLRNVP